MVSPLGSWTEHTVTDVGVGKLHSEGGVSGDGESDSSGASGRMVLRSDTDDNDCDRIEFRSE